MGRGWVGREGMGSAGATEFELPFLLLLWPIHFNPVVNTSSVSNKIYDTGTQSNNHFAK